MVLDVVNPAIMMQILGGVVLTPLIFLTLSHNENNIEGIFLIQDNGRLIKKISRKDRHDYDDNLIPDMLLFAKEFIKDSFIGDEGLDLKKLKLRNGGILFERGKRIYLAVIHTGDVTNEMQRRITNTVKDIEFDFCDGLAIWDAPSEKLEDVENKLQSLMLE